MRIVVINLDRSTDRLARFTRNNGFLTRVERFSALDGRTLDREQLKARGLLDPELDCTDGALGCTLSHLAVWEQACSAGVATTVCEDDAVLNRGFVHQAERLITGLPPGWDLIIWGWNFDSYLAIELLPGVSRSAIYFDQTTMRRQLDRFQTLTIEPRAFRLLSSCGSLCYTVSAEGARRLKAGCTPLKPLLFPDASGRPKAVPYGLDHAMTALYPRISAYAAFPPLAVSPNEPLSSTVQIA